MSVEVTLPQPYDNLRTRGLLTGSGNAAANATLLQARIDASGAGVVWVPPGTYYYNTALIPKTNVIVKAATRGATTLIYTGSGNAIDATLANRADGIYHAGFEGITFQFGGSGSGHGFNANVWRYSWMRDCRFKLFPGNGVHLDGNSGGTQGCWTNRFDDVECEYNGGHGWYFGIQSNAVVCHGCIGSVNGLDGFKAEKNARVTLVAPQAEANGRHAFSSFGAQSLNIVSPYVEHQSPEFWGFESSIPGYSASTDRFILYVTQSSDATPSKRVSVHGGHLEGGDNGTTSTTRGPLFAEHCYSLKFQPDYLANFRSNRGPQIASTVRRYVGPDRPVVNDSDDTIANSSMYLAMLYDYATGGITTDRRGVIGANEGFINLLPNGGFDTELLTATGAPQGWTVLSGTASRWTREAGSDGGIRIVGTNSTTQSNIIHRILTGPDVAQAASVGVVTMVFSAIVPTANTRGEATVRIDCFDDADSDVGGGLDSWALPESNTELTYHLSVPVLATTTRIRILVQTSSGGTSNSDVIKVDQMALYLGEVPKHYAPAPITENGGSLLGGLQIPVKAGAFSDADFSVAPANNSLIGMDTSNNRVYFKVNDGSYKYATLT